jgi:hypothetical protein
MTLCAFLLKLLAILAIASTAAAQERIISKPDADMIFAFTRAEWERYVRQVAPPEGWTLRLQPHDTGTGLARFNRSTGIGASIQPLFSDDQGPPGMIVAGSYYPLGFMRITDALIKKIEQAARLDLGPAYSVSANHAKMPGTNIEAIELIVTRDTVATRRPDAAERPLEYTDHVYDFAFQFPSDWKLQKTPALGEIGELRVLVLSPRKGRSVMAVVTSFGKSFTKEQFERTPDRESIVKRWIEATVEQIHKKTSRDIGASRMIVSEKRALPSDVGIKFYISTAHFLDKAVMSVSSIHVMPFGKDYMVNFVMISPVDPKATAENETEDETMKKVFNSFHVVGERPN